MNMLKNIIYFVLSIQEKILKHRLNNTIGIKNKSARKKIYGNGILLNFDSIADKERAELEAECEIILKNAEYKPDNILEYINKQGTQVIYINNKSALGIISEDEGFIYPQKGIKALYLSFLTKNKLSFTTNDMFILTKGEINTYFFMYHFYNWYMFKHNISGIGAEEMNLLNRYLYNASEEDINKLQLDDIYKLKDAIAQDKSAIEFVVNLCKKYEGSKKAFEKLKDEGTSL